MPEEVAESEPEACVGRCTELYIKGDAVTLGRELVGGAGKFAIFSLGNERIGRVVADPNPVFTRRIRREVSLLQSCDHPGIARIIAPVTAPTGVILGYATEQLVIDNFWRELYPSGLTVDRLLTHTIQLTNTILYLQDEKDHVHGDIKPGNLGFRKHPDGSWQIVLLDWELCCILGGRPIGDPSTNKYDEHDPHPPVPPQRATIGTPAFMSPEHSVGMTFGSGVDPFLIILTMLSIITERHGYSQKGDTLLVTTLNKAACVQYPHWTIVEKQLPIPPLLRLLRRGMQKQYMKDGRFNNARELKDTLEAVRAELTAEQLAFIIT